MRLILAFLLLFTVASVYSDDFLTGVGRKMRQMVLFNATLDTDDTAASTTGMQIGGFSLVGLFATTSSGTLTTAVIELQGSPDNSADNWIALVPAVELTGEGMVVATSVPFRYIRANTKTAQGAASVADVFLQAK